MYLFDARKGTEKGSFIADVGVFLGCYSLAIAEVCRVRAPGPDGLCALPRTHAAACRERVRFS